MPETVDKAEEFELRCFQLVSHVGMARTYYVEAINAAEKGDFDECRRCLDEGNKMFSQGHEVHAAMLAREASGEVLPFRIIILHAEDLMMSAETLRILAEKFITLYQKIEEE